MLPTSTHRSWLGRLLPGAMLVTTLAGCDGLVQPMQRVPWTPRVADDGGGGGDEKVSVSVASIVKSRCSPCHSAAPTYPGRSSAPLGVAFDTSDQIVTSADRIKVRAVDKKTMPPPDTTKMTEEERAAVGRWVASLQKS